VVRLLAWVRRRTVKQPLSTGQRYQLYEIDVIQVLLQTSLLIVVLYFPVLEKPGFTIVGLQHAKHHTNQLDFSD